MTRPTPHGEFTSVMNEIAEPTIKNGDMKSTDLTTIPTLKYPSNPNDMDKLRTTNNMGIPKTSSSIHLTIHLAIPCK